MSVALLAALLRRAVPDLTVLDCAVARGGLYPFWPEARLAAPIEGFAPAPPDPTERPGLVATDLADAASWLRDGAMVLTRGAPASATPRVMLLLGLGGAVEQHDLLLPEGVLETLLPALSAAAEAMAAPGWEWATRAITPRLATLTLLTPAEALPPVRLHDAQLVQAREAPGRLRVLLGVLPVRPWRLRLDVEGAPRVFLDGYPHAPGAPFTPDPGLPVILGLAGEGVVLRGVEILPA